MDNLKTGSLIRELRKEKGLTQLELARQLHITDRAVSKWERGLCAPDIALLEPLSQALGTTVTELITGRRDTEAEAVAATVIAYSSLEISRKTSLAKKKILTIVLILCLLLPILNRFVRGDGFVWECVPAWICARQAAAALTDYDTDRITAHLGDAEALSTALAALENQGVRIVSANARFSRVRLEDMFLLLEIEFVVEYEGLRYQLTCPGTWQHGKVELMHVLYSGQWDSCPEWFQQFSAAVSTYDPG